MKIVKEVWYIHSKFDSKTKRRVTACCLVTEDDKFLVGVSVCSEKDNFSRKFGREKAYERARTNHTFDITTMLNKSDKPRKMFCQWCTEHMFSEFLFSQRLHKEIDYKDKDQSGKRIKPKVNLFKRLKQFIISSYGN